MKRDGSLHPRVCQITTASRPLDTRVFSRECRTLARHGFDVVLIIQHPRSETIDGVRIVPLRTPPNRPTRIFLRTLTALRLALREKADIYHIHDPELVPVGAVLRLLTGKPVIYGVREDYPKLAHHKHYLPRAVRPAIGLAVRAMEESASRAFDAVVAVTDDIASNFARHHRTVLVRNFPVLPDEPLRMPPKKPDDHPFTMIYVGELTVIRGVATMVEAVEQLAERIPCRLILVGSFEDPALEAALRKRSPNTDFLGYVDIRENPEVLRRADVGLVCLHPTRHYITSLPLKLFDYMLAGLPVIASDFPLWKEIVVGSRAGVCVNPLRSDAIADAAFRMSENPDATIEMGQRGQQAVTEQYNWQRESTRLVELYDELVHASGRKSGTIPAFAGRELGQVGAAPLRNSWER